MSERTEKDEVIDRVFELFVEDDLNAFVIAAQTDDEIHAITYADADDTPLQLVDQSLCQWPRHQLVGRLIAELALLFGQPPDKIADVAHHVATDHFDVDQATIEESWADILSDDDFLASVLDDDEFFSILDNQEIPDMLPENQE